MIPKGFFLCALFVGLRNQANKHDCVTQDAEKAVQYNILKREAESNRTLYESMLSRVKESSIASAMRATTAGHA